MIAAANIFIINISRKNFDQESKLSRVEMNQIFVKNVQVLKNSLAVDSVIFKMILINVGINF